MLQGSEQQDGRPVCSILMAIVAALMIVPGAFAAEVPLFEAYHATGPYSIYADGIGLQGTGGTGTLQNVNITGPVQKAYLYWVGANLPATNTATDDTVTFTRSGSPGVNVMADASYVLPFERPFSPGTYFWNANHSVYVADVTQLVTSGTFDYTLADFDMDEEYGFGLQVVYEDEAVEPSDVAIFQGHDFAFSGWNGGGELTRTNVVTFEFEPSNEDRVLRATFFAAGGEDTDRPDQLWALTGVANSPADLPTELITNNLGTVIDDNPLEAAQDAEWDTVIKEIEIPAGANFASFQFQSGGGSGTGAPAESFSWMSSTFSIVPEPATLAMLGLGAVCVLRRKR